MKIYKLLSLLLDYPDDELYASLPEMDVAIESLDEISDHERSELRRVIRWMQLQSLLELQGEYVQTFDLTAEHSLHLTHHLFGDDRGRGPALVDLGEHYSGTGLEVAGNELPDYLPLILEYVSTLDPLGAQMFLNDAAKVLTVLADNLEQAASPRAPLVRMVENRGRLARKTA